MNIKAYLSIYATAQCPRTRSRIKRKILFLIHKTTTKWSFANLYKTFTPNNTASKSNYVSVKFIKVSVVYFVQLVLEHREWERRVGVVEVNGDMKRLGDIVLRSSSRCHVHDICACFLIATLTNKSSGCMLWRRQQHFLWITASVPVPDTPHSTAILASTPA